MSRTSWLEDLVLTGPSLHSGPNAPPTASRTFVPGGLTELAQDFPGEYRSRGRIIAALLLTKELKKLGIRFEERATLHKEIAKLIDPLSSTHLSSVGMDEINHYSLGGFDVLTEWFDDRPRHLETFLPKFRAQLKTALSEVTGLNT